MLTPGGSLGLGCVGKNSNKLLTISKKVRHRFGIPLNFRQNLMQVGLN